MKSFQPLYYFGDIHSWSQKITQSEMVLDIHQPFVPSGMWNRTQIATANGIQLLSIPIEGGRRVRGIYHQIKISNTTDWQKNHWHSIQSAYGRAAYWEYYCDAIRPLYTKKFTHLCDFNLNSFEVVAKILKTSFNYRLSNEATEDFKQYSTIENNENYPVYFQTFSDKYAFIPNLSILDLMLNCGNNSINYLQKINQIYV